MYKKILVPLENSPTDQIILNHVRGLAKLCGASLLFVHVADGFVARNQSTLNLSESEEIKTDREYLERVNQEFTNEGFTSTQLLLCGEPSQQLLGTIEQENCDLVAMATHGHGIFEDILWGSVADKVRHRTSTPVLMIRAPL